MVPDEAVLLVCIRRERIVDPLPWRIVVIRVLRRPWSPEICRWGRSPLPRSDKIK